MHLKLSDAYEVVFNHIWLLSFPNCILIKYICKKLERFYFHRDCQICPQSLRPVTQQWRTRSDTRSPRTTVWMTFIIDYTSRRLHSHGAKQASSTRSSRTILDISRTYFSLVVIKSKVCPFFSNSSILVATLQGHELAHELVHQNQASQISYNAQNDIW